MILDPPRHAFRVAPVDELGVLIDADDYYREFYRAASRAERTILLSGWQFDSDVALLRGAEAEHARGPVTLLKFLNALCRQKPDLRIWILAWDFSLVFAAEREWMQRVVFEWSSHEHLNFRFDSNHVERGCHHQKFVVIDGELSFLGGLDLCDDRWDTRRHAAIDPLRVSDGAPHHPFHDIQLYLRGPQVAAGLTELFLERWARAGGVPIQLPTLDAPPPRTGIDGLLALPAAEVALSRTDPHGAPGGPKLCTEIRALYQDAIAAAERLIYIETQYFSAAAIGDALEKRLRDPRGPLEIVMVLNMRGETLKEQAAVGLAQAQLIGRLRNVASETSHALGIYYTVPSGETPETPDRTTYIHSKVMIVDDRWLTVGSANLTNRSLAVDTELNATVEAEHAETALGFAIRKLRASLLGEHSGGPEIALVEGLVAHLDALALNKREAARRLRRHPSPTISERAALALVDPQQLPFDPSQVEDFDEEAKTDFLSALGRTVRELFANHRDKG
jgi:phospholipase D1/2